MVSEVRLSRDAGIDYGGYDNDGSSGQSSAAFLDDRLDAMRFESAVPGSGLAEWFTRVATFGVPAAMDAAARIEEAKARVQIAQASNVGATFGGYNGRTVIAPQPGAPLAGPGSIAGMDSGTLLLLAAVGVAVYMIAAD